MDDPLAFALAQAERQLAALERNDFDAFLAGEQMYEDSCGAAARSPGAGPEAAARLERLVMLAASISGQLDRLAAGAARQLGDLARNRTATLAYLRAADGMALTSREG